MPEDKLYAKTTGFCFECGSDVPAAYRETGEGMDLETDCTVLMTDPYIRLTAK